MYTNRKPKRLVWNFNEANWDALNSFFANFNWSSCYSGDVNQAVVLFSNTVLEGMRSNISHSFKNPNLK